MTVEAGGAASGASEWVTCLTYKSVATAKPSADDIEDLVAQARARNRRLDITGMLLFEDGHFLQTIEGPPAALEAVWSSIKRDSRHDHIELLSEHIALERLFSNWDLLADGRMGMVPPPKSPFPA